MAMSECLPLFVAVALEATVLLPYDCWMQALCGRHMIFGRPPQETIGSDTKTPPPYSLISHAVSGSFAS